ncbi:MAG: PIN domain-containing protein [Acidobacteriota bacterium]
MCIEEALSGPTPVGLPWLTIWAFLSISTNPRAFEQPLALIELAEEYWEIFRRLLLEAQVSGPLVTDAALAALALEQGAAVCTTDRDFARFPDVKTIDPTQA